MAKKTKKMQRGGRSEATHMASGQPIQWQSGATGQRRKADYMSHVAPKVARKQMRRQAAAGGPGRGAVRAAGPGGKAGGAVKKMQRGRSVETMASGQPIQWQSGPTGQRRKRDYMSYVAPGAAKRQLAKQAASGGPGRRAAHIGGGGWKGGGAVSMNKGGSVPSYNDLIRSKGW